MEELVGKEEEKKLTGGGGRKSSKKEKKEAEKMRRPSIVPSKTSEVTTPHSFSLPNILTFKAEKNETSRN